MNCLWILILLCLCNNRNDSGCEREERRSEREECGCERESRREEREEHREERREERRRDREDDCGMGRRFMNDNDAFDMPRGEGRMPSNFQRNTCGCEMKDE